jgi:hypothetical protein
LVSSVRFRFLVLERRPFRCVQAVSRNPRFCAFPKLCAFPKKPLAWDVSEIKPPCFYKVGNECVREDVAMILWPAGALLVSSLIAAVAQDQSEIPPLRRLATHSFRGPLKPGDQLPNFDVSGHACVVCKSVHVPTIGTLVVLTRPLD